MTNIERILIQQARDIAGDSPYDHGEGYHWQRGKARMLEDITDQLYLAGFIGMEAQISVLRILKDEVAQALKK